MFDKLFKVETRYYLSKEFSEKGYILMQSIMLFYFQQSFSELITLTYSTQLLTTSISITIFPIFLIFLSTIITFQVGFIKGVTRDRKMYQGTIMVLSYLFIKGIYGISINFSYYNRIFRNASKTMVFMYWNDAFFILFSVLSDQQRNQKGRKVN
jgi:hypothetical protein